MKTVKSAAICVSLLLLSSSLLAQKTMTDSLRQDIDTAKNKVYPALVNISVVMRYFNAGRAQRSAAGGSGVIIAKEGYVLTNYHVAGNTTRITCTMPDGESLDADVVTHDPLTDLSVLKLHLEKRADPKAPLPFAALGDSDTLQVGDYVMAMGNPLMLSSSMTLGIVSNTKRVFTDFAGTDMEDMELDFGEKTGLLTRWIQHDALILPGNSGGPLVNLKGEVVGINELGGGGVGFAIPSNIAAKVFKQAIASGKIQRSWIGVTVLPVGKIGRTEGALVSSIQPGSSAEKSGLKAGDIILSVNNEPINTRFFEEVPLFYQRVSALEVGKAVPIKYLRSGSEHTADVSPVEMQPSIGKEEEFRTAGITVEEITAPMALFREYPDSKGVVVTGVRPGFPFEAAQPPLAESDVILSIGGTPITDLASFRKAMASADGKDAPVVFRRNYEQVVTFVKAPKDKPDTDGGELPKAWLGVKTQVLTPEVAGAVHQPSAKGYRITEVYPQTEASKAGLQVGDLLVGLNNDKLTAARLQDAEDLRRTIEDLPIGQKATFSVLRDGKPVTVAVVMEATPASSTQAKSSTQKEFEFTVRELKPMDLMEKRWIKEKSGLIVTESVSGGLANIAGLELDDVIISINGEAVGDVDAFERVMKSIIEKKPRVVQIFVRRHYRTHFVFIEPEWTKLSAGS